MSTSSRQDADFLATVVTNKFDNTLLEEAIEWIAKNLKPEDVFETELLGSWATENGYLTSED